MLRKIIQIDEERCNGCGLCAEACHEGAIGMVNGKAKLLRENFCDGFGDCLPACPQDAIHFVEREAPAYDASAVEAAKAAAPAVGSALTNWPVQLRLAPVQAPCFDGSELLVAADCSAFACGDFHRRYLAGRAVVIGCPKLDQADYAGKLAEILRQNDIRGVTVTRMEVPCCGGLERAVKSAILASGKQIPLRVVVLRADGSVLLER